MIPWTSVERRWRDALLAAMIPPAAALAAPAAQPPAAAALPGLGELDLVPFWTAYERCAPPLLRLGVRVAVWVLSLAPILVLAVPCLFTQLEPEERDRMLERAARSDWYVLRQMVVTLKLLACFAYFREPAVRALTEGPGSGCGP
ncbi:MAG: hypothetical protein HY744_34510 [Deltaproteobacteria bacterium]|nr:hypothetical protein [Deltaproteobacteria bacterium]